MKTTRAATPRVRARPMSSQRNPMSQIGMATGPIRAIWSDRNFKGAKSPA